jgi:hypothetical protein
VPAPGGTIAVLAMHNSRETVPVSVGKLDLAITVRVSADLREVQ